MQTFLSDYPAKLRNIKRAIAHKDAPALASAAHAMKGAVAIFGAEDAVESAVDLQQMGRRGNLANAAASFRKLDEALARLNAKLREYARFSETKSFRFEPGQAQRTEIAPARESWSPSLAIGVVSCGAEEPGHVRNPRL